jgi:hypothetical protein
MNKRLLHLLNQAGFHQPEIERLGIEHKFEALLKLTVRDCAQYVEDKFDFCGDEIVVAEHLREHYGVEE